MAFRIATLACLRRGRGGGNYLRVLTAAEDQIHWRVTKHRWHMGHAHHQGGGGGEENERVFRLGLAADVGLAAGKAFTGYVSGSTAIIADAAHSVSDIVLSGVAWLSFRAARAPRDKDHPYGHGKFETLGALGISGMLLVTAGGIAWHAVDVLQGLLMSASDTINHSLVHNHHNSHNHGGHSHGVDLEHPILAVSVTILSISVKEGLYWITKRAGEREGSGLMKANAWHHRADAVSSVVALIGVGGSIMGIPFLDPLAGLVVSGMVLKAGLETGYQSVLELVDAAVPKNVLEPINQTILQVEGVKGCHRMRGRKAGSFLFLDVHIEVDPFLSVSAAHDIGESVRRQIQKTHSQVAEVFIHIDPSYSSCKSLPDGTMKKDTADNGQKDAEAVVSDVFASLYPEKITVEHITHHSLMGKVMLQVQVSMPSDMLIRDAMNLAKEAERTIMKSTSGINQVSTQLRLSQPITQFNQGEIKKGDILHSQN